MALAFGVEMIVEGKQRSLGVFQAHTVRVNKVWFMSALAETKSRPSLNRPGRSPVALPRALAHIASSLAGEFRSNRNLTEGGPVGLCANRLLWSASVPVTSLSCLSPQNSDNIPPGFEPISLLEALNGLRSVSPGIPSAPLYDAINFSGDPMSGRQLGSVERSADAGLQKGKVSKSPDR